MQNPSPPANIVDAIVIGFMQVLAPGFEALAQLIFATMIAGPALATMLLLWLDRRAALFRRSKPATAVAAVLLSLIGGYVFAWAAASLSQAFDAHAGVYQLVLPAALALAALALVLQWSARSSFSAVRAIGVASAILTPLTLIAIDALL
jgi:glucan phosphoethanolaminetransferase (alkaline phosphatase superfamily)